MTTVFRSPASYVQGPGEMNRIGSYASSFGKKALCLISAGGKKRQGAQIEQSFAAAGCGLVFEMFNGECCHTEINRILSVVKESGCEVIIGVGGGKIFDTAKAVSYYAKLPVMICPTIASTDAPCSALSVIYTDEGAFQEYLPLSANPNLVMMDTEIIAASPVRLTVSGMGDAMATYFEARACQAAGGVTTAGGHVGLAAHGIAKLCYDTLINEGVKAKVALEAKACTPAVEHVIEANTLLSGIGFESGGLAAAHAVHNGLTTLEETHHMQHGEKVNFGTITQLVLEDMPESELNDILSWMVAVGLPVTLSELGVTDLSREHLLPAAEAACAENDTMGNLPFAVTPENVYHAMLAADAFGRKALNK